MKFGCKPRRRLGAALPQIMRAWPWRLLFLGWLWGGGLVVRAADPLPPAVTLWKFAVDRGWKLPLLTGKTFNTCSSTPAVAPDGTVCWGTFYGRFFAVTPEGKEKWRFQAGREIHSSPAIAADGTIYFGSRDRNLYALNPDGRLKWKFGTRGWVDSSPALAVDGTVYFGSWDKHFYALNPDGSLKWQFATGAVVDSSPAIATNGVVYFGSHDDYFYALNPDGTLRWKFLTGGEIVSSPAIGADGTVYFSALNGDLYALNPDGTGRWRYHSGSTTRSSPILDAQGNIVIGNTNRTEVISAAGKKLWHYGSPVPVEVAAAAVAGGFYFSTPWRHLLAMDASRTRGLWQADLGDNISESLTVDEKGTIYVCVPSQLLAIRPPVPPPLARGSWPMFRGNAQHTGRAGK